jgi:cell division protein FtsA
MDTRIGYPNEHLAGNNDTETTSPVYATAVGLVMNSLEHGEKKFQEEVVLKSKEEREKEEAELQEDFEQNPPEGEDLRQDPEAPKKQPKKSIFDKWAEKFKDFLDNAE